MQQALELLVSGSKETRDKTGVLMPSIAAAIVRILKPNCPLTKARSDSQSITSPGSDWEQSICRKAQDRGYRTDLLHNIAVVSELRAWSPIPRTEQIWLVTNLLQNLNSVCDSFQSQMSDVSQQVPIPSLLACLHVSSAYSDCKHGLTHLPLLALVLPDTGTYSCSVVRLFVTIGPLRRSTGVFQFVEQITRLLFAAIATKGRRR